MEALPRRPPSTAPSDGLASSLGWHAVKTLVIGTGGREHALARALSLDPGVTEVHVAPGNPGIAAVATLHDVDPMAGDDVAALAEKLGVDLVVVGPEAPLVEGVADAVRAGGSPASGRRARRPGSRARRPSPRT